MQRAMIWLGLGFVAFALGLWAMGGWEWLVGWAVSAQHAVQDDLAAAVRRLRGHEAGAMAGLLALCFAYGFLHAVGPGHGKALIGGYGVARRVALWPLAGLALLSSLAQSLVAIALVYGFVLLLGWTRPEVEGMSQRWLTPASQSAILLIGLWLVLRGLRHARQSGQASAVHVHHDHHEHHNHHHHDHHHDHHHGEQCNHAHGPTLEQVQGLTGWRDAALLVGGIAIRPCSGALFLLVITWSFGIAFAGIAGVLAMGLGTACVTVAVAGLSVWARESALLSLPEKAALRVLPLIEIAAGLTIALIAALMLWRGV